MHLAQEKQPPFTQIIITTTEFGTTINSSFVVGARIDLTCEMLHDVVESFRELARVAPDEGDEGGGDDVAPPKAEDDIVEVETEPVRH